MARSFVCLKCHETTSNGTKCARCAGGRRSPRPPNRYPASYRRVRDRLVAEHIARHGLVCPQCRERQASSSRLTADHITPLSAGGDVLGPMRVLCLRCNVQAIHALRPDLARRGR